MGIYSELVLGVELVPETPEEVITIIKFLCREEGYDDLPGDVTFPNHPFFRNTDFEGIFSYLQNSFDSIPGSTLTLNEYSKGHVLTVRAHRKNYSMEYENFLDWIAPYCHTGKNILDFVGYIRDEDLYAPTLVYCFRGQIWLAGITEFSGGYYDENGEFVEEFVPDNSDTELRIEPFILVRNYIDKYSRKI